MKTGYSHSINSVGMTGFCFFAKRERITIILQRCIKGKAGNRQRCTRRKAGNRQRCTKGKAGNRQRCIKRKTGLYPCIKRESEKQLRKNIDAMSEMPYNKDVDIVSA